MYQFFAASVISDMNVKEDCVNDKETDCANNATLPIAIRNTTRQFLQAIWARDAEMPVKNTFVNFQIPTHSMHSASALRRTKSLPVVPLVSWPSPSESNSSDVDSSEAHRVLPLDSLELSEFYACESLSDEVYKISAEKCLFHARTLSDSIDAESTSSGGDSWIMPLSLISSNESHGGLEDNFDCPPSFNRLEHSFEQEEASEATWINRESKRTKPVNALKATAVYINNQDVDLFVRPQTPDPASRLSKRHWESEIAGWRNDWREIDGVRWLVRKGFEESASKNAWRDAKPKGEQAKQPHDQEAQLQEAEKLLRAQTERE
jgi:hypothetical protein